jgi:hypothetical protein
MTLFLKQWKLLHPHLVPELILLKDEMEGVNLTITRILNKQDSNRQVSPAKK